MTKFIVLSITGALSITLSVGCGDVDTGQNSGASKVIASGAKRQAAVPDPPSKIVDKRGRNWTRGRAVVYAPNSPPKDKFPPPAETSETEEKKLAAMTDEGLAQKLSPISMYAGYEYSLDKPSVEGAVQFKEYLARKARGETIPPVRGKGWSRGSTKGPLGQEPPNIVGVKTTQSEELPYIIGTDNRGQQRENTAFPWSTMLLITDDVLSSGCSAQLVGPSTATSVAHCFKPDGSTWYSPRDWAPGVDSEDAEPFPWGRWNGCYWVTLPSSYSSPMGYYDFAVIEFSDMYPSCNLYPGDSAGYINWSSDFVPNGSETGYVYGYPGTSCPGSASCNFPQIWGIGSDNMDEDTDNIDHYADTTGGQSGAALYVNEGGNRYMVGSHQGGYATTETWNEARRLEGLFFSYLIDYTAQ